MMSMDRKNKKNGAQHAQLLVAIFCYACIFLSPAHGAEKYIDALAAETAFPFGNGFLLFISKQGNLSSVGKNSSGQLGIGTMLDALVATKIGGEYAAISKGIDHSVGLKANGDVWAWGRNSGGELGDGTTSNRLIPTKIGHSYHSIATGDISTLGLKVNGELWSWGNNREGQLGVNRFEQVGSTTSVPFFTPTPVLVGSNFKSIAARYRHGLAIKENGDLWTWGSWLRTGGREPIGVVNGGILPGKIGSDFIEAAAGSGHSLGIKQDSSLWGWGHGWAAGAETRGGLLTQPVKLGSGYKAIKAGRGLSVALKADGTLEMWGEGSFPEGFNGIKNPDLIAPTPRAIGKDFVALLDVGGGLKSDGSLWFWGEPQLPSTGATLAGLGVVRNRPTQVGVDYQQVAVSGGYLLGLKTDGSLWAWGSNAFGQLGINSTLDQYTPVFVGAGFKAVSASRSQGEFFNGLGFGYGHGLALKSDGQLFAWGDNRFGQLGVGDRNERLTPSPVDHRFRTVSAGAYHSLGVKDDDTLWAWGNNQFGRLGDGTQADKASPVLIGSGFVTAQADTERSIGIKRDGSIWVWGNWPYPVKLNGNISIRKEPDIFLPIGKYLVPRRLSFGEAPIAELDFDRAVLKTGFGAALQIEIDYLYPVNGLNDVAKLAVNGRPRFVKTTSSNRFRTIPGRLLLGEDGSVWEESRNFDIGQYEYEKVATGFRDIAGNDHTVAAIGTDNSLWIWGDAHHGQIPIPAIPYFIVPRHSVILDPPETQKAVCLFDWAQVVYPTLFSPPGNLHESSTAPGASYLFRAFPGTQSYLGVADGVLYYLGPASNNTIARIGLVADWLERSACD